jgi:hypothetical protein
MQDKPLAGLRDAVYDAIAAGRHTLLIDEANTSAAERVTFPVTFEISLDRATYDLVAKTAEHQKRSIRRVMRRYARDCFCQCIAEGEPAEA